MNFFYFAIVIARLRESTGGAEEFQADNAADDRRQAQQPRKRHGIPEIQNSDYYRSDRADSRPQVQGTA